MKNFKITNLKSKVVQYMNESETKQFFTRNLRGNYMQENMVYVKQRAYNKKLYDFAFSVAVMGIFTILLMLMCSTLGFIDSLIF